LQLLDQKSAFRRTQDIPMFEQMVLTELAQSLQEISGHGVHR
jgi:hypothetical protein